MKVTVALLLYITTAVRADVIIGNAPPDPFAAPAEVELTPTEREAADLILKGDGRALANDREEALSLWAQGYSHNDAGEQQKQDATERLQWACGGTGIGWGPEKPGRSFALFRRDSFLGANEAARLGFIRAYCHDIDPEQAHPEFDAYATWLHAMQPEDKNFELLPSILEGDLAGNHSWQSQVLPSISDYDFLLNPDRALQVVKLLGSAQGSFNAEMLDEDGEQTLMCRIIDELSSATDGEPDKYKRTRAAVKKFLDSLKATTLDSDFMLTLLQWKDGKALAKFQAKHSAELAAMESAPQQRILQMLERMKGCPQVSEMDMILQRGDANALAGDREKAKGQWGLVMTLSPTGIVPRDDAMERLTWARPQGNIETWGPEKAGQAFANHMREVFLGADAAERQSLIKNYCTGHDETGEIRAKFDRYGLWIRNQLDEDKDLNVLPLVLDGELADFQPWLAMTIPQLGFPSDRQRTIKTMEMLGFLGDTKTFNPRLFGQDGDHSALAFMTAGLRGMNNGGDNKQRAAYDAIMKYLKALQPRTFGADLVLTLLENDSAASVSPFLKAHQADIAQLPETFRQPVLDMLRTAWPQMPELSAGSKP